MTAARATAAHSGRRVGGQPRTEPRQAVSAQQQCQGLETSHPEILAAPHRRHLQRRRPLGVARGCGSSKGLGRRPHGRARSTALTAAKKSSQWISRGGRPPCTRSRSRGRPLTAVAGRAGRRAGDGIGGAVTGQCAADETGAVPGLTAGANAVGAASIRLTAAVGRRLHRRPIGGAPNPHQETSPGER